MSDTVKKWGDIGFYPADILLPKAGTDMTKWAVVACDQFSSQPEYWANVEKTVGEAPSTLRLILPEWQLHNPGIFGRVARINATMNEYVNAGMFQTIENAMIYVERTQSDGKIRRGLVGMVDLEQYDYNPGSTSLIRATEGTVMTRLPARVRVRRKASLELPHVMVLIDDPGRTVIEPLEGAPGMEPLYDFPLQQGGGAVRGWKLTPEQMDSVETALRALSTPEAMEKKYGLKDAAPLRFAVGDGNHSLAAAKQCWEEEKVTYSKEEWESLPGRYAMVELVNLHEFALQFEPIHRVVFDTDPDALIKAFREATGAAQGWRDTGHSMQFVWEGHDVWYNVPNPKAQLAVGTLQSFLDDYVRQNDLTVDYIHGDEAARTLGQTPGNIAILLPAMGKNELFKTVIADGVLPRKTFSMGEARDKRYYVEARKIR
ncbi:MAG: DUF1015 domain-containing protein [Oscillibacter sp.]|nr:DUF1015 domain-containing protein [Oscillibacter sp.]